MNNKKVKWHYILKDIITPLLRANEPLRRNRTGQNLDRDGIHHEIQTSFAFVLRSLKSASSRFLKLEKKAGGIYSAKVQDFSAQNQQVIKESLKKISYLATNQGLCFSIPENREAVLEHVQNWHFGDDYKALTTSDQIPMKLSELEDLVTCHVGHSIQPLTTSEVAKTIYTRVFDEGLSKEVLDPSFCTQQKGIIDLTLNERDSGSDSESSAASETADTERLLDFSEIKNLVKNDATELDLKVFNPDISVLELEIKDKIEAPLALFRDYVEDDNCIAEASKAISYSYLLGPDAMAFLPLCLSLVGGDYVGFSLEIFKILKIVGALKERDYSDATIAYIIKVYLLEHIGLKDILIDPAVVDELDLAEKKYELNPSVEDGLNPRVTRSRTLDSYNLELGKSWKIFKNIIPDLGKNWVKFDWRKSKELVKEKEGRDMFGPRIHDDDW